MALITTTGHSSRLPRPGGSVRLLVRINVPHRRPRVRKAPASARRGYELAAVREIHRPDHGPKRQVLVLFPGPGVPYNHLAVGIG